MYKWVSKWRLGAFYLTCNYPFILLANQELLFLFVQLEKTPAELAPITNQQPFNKLFGPILLVLQFFLPVCAWCEFYVVGTILLFRFTGDCRVKALFIVQCLDRVFCHLSRFYLIVAGSSSANTSRCCITRKNVWREHPAVHEVPSKIK